MKKTLIFLLLVSFAFAPVLRAERQLLDRVVAIVNDEAITQSELDILLRPIYEQYRTEYHGEQLIEALDKARIALLNQIIEDRLVFQEAKAQKIEVPPARIDERVAEFRARFPDETSMEKELLTQGLSLTDIRERFHRQEMIRALHNQEIRTRIVVSPKEIEEYYDLHKGEFATQEQIKTRSITINKNQESRDLGILDEEAKKKIDALKNRISAGEDFTEIAKANSEDTNAKDGGLSGWIKRGDMIQAIDAVIFGLKVGETSNVIESPMGYHLFRVEERKEGYDYTLDDVRDKIFSELYRQKTEERFKDWVNDLKKSAYISIR